MADVAQAALIDGLAKGAPAAALALTEREAALVAYADQLTRAPSSVRAPDIARLRGVGLDDRAIHDACAIVAYFAFVNRIADGLGVELEDGGSGLEPGDAGPTADPAGGRLGP